MREEARQRAQRAHDDGRALGDNSDAEERFYDQILVENERSESDAKLITRLNKQVAANTSALSEAAHNVAETSRELRASQQQCHINKQGPFGALLALFREMRLAP